jgi:hypothetical protein
MLHQQTGSNYHIPGLSQVFKNSDQLLLLHYIVELYGQHMYMLQVLTCGLVDGCQHFKGTLCIHRDSFTLKMQMACFSKTFITRYLTVPCHNPKDYIQQYVLM